jgi:nitrogen regulatory protein PII
VRKIEAYIRHEAFEPIRMELLELGFPSLSISEVKGSGRQKGITERYRGAELTNYLRPKVKLECVVADEDVQTIVDTILKHGRTGAVGDGKVFVVPVEEAYRVRTGESGEEILQAHPDAAAADHLGPPHRETSVRAAAIGRRTAGACGTEHPPHARHPESRARGPGAPASAAGLVERLRAVHLEMVDAVLGGDGLERVARLAAEAAQAPVAIVIPRLGAAVMQPVPRDPVLDAMRRYVADRVKDRPSQVPDGLVLEVPIASGDEVVGAVVLLAPSPHPEAAEFLHLAAVACLTEVAIEEAKEEVEQNLRGSFLEDVRSRPELEPREIVRAPAAWAATSRAGPSCSAPSSPRTARATSWRSSAASTPAPWPSTWRTGSTRSCPPPAGDGAPEATLERARRLAERLRQHGTVGLSSFYTDPGELARAMQEAELVLDVLRQSGAGGWEGGPRPAAGHRHGHLPPALPGPGLPSRGGPLLLRRHRRGAREVRRPVPHGPRRDARGLPRAELQHERDRRGDLRPPPHRSPTASSA